MVRVAVCICTCDRLASLAQVLAVLENIELGDMVPDDVGVIVVDNRPDGRVRALCEQVGARLPVRLECVEEARPGISFARNRAVAEARVRRADFVAFLDDDDLPEPDWLRALARHAAQRPARIWCSASGGCRPRSSCLAGCATRAISARRPRRPQPLRASGLGWHLQPAGLAGGPGAPGRPDGPFLQEFAHSGGEDSDLFIRAQRAGFTYACAVDSIVVRTWEPRRLTLRGILRRGFLLGGARVHLARAHLPAPQTKGLVWSSWRKLAKSLLQLPLAATGGSRLVGPDAGHGPGAGRALRLDGTALHLLSAAPRVRPGGCASSAVISCRYSRIHPAR